MGKLERPSRLKPRIDEPEREEQLRESEARFRALSELSSDWYWQQDAELRFVATGGATDARGGITPAAHIGKRRWELPNTEIVNQTWDEHRAILEAHQPFRDLLLRRTGADGTEHLVSVAGKPAFDRAGCFRGYVGIASDVTERKRAEQLRDLEHKVNRGLAEAKSAGESVRVAIRSVCEVTAWECGRYFRVDESVDVLRFADAWGTSDPAIAKFIEASRDLVYRRGQGLSGHVWQSGEPVWSSDVTKDPRASGSSQTSALRAAGVHGTFVFPVKADGRIVGVLSFASRTPRRPDERLLEAIAVIGAQIGQFLQRKHAEEELRRFKLAMDSSADMILLVDRSTMRFVDANSTVCRLLGYSREELLQIRLDELLPVSLEELAAAYDQQIANPEVPGGLTSYYRCKDGSTLPFESKRQVLRSGDTWLISIVARDIRERIATEEALQESEARFRSLTELSSDWYWEQDENFRFIAQTGDSMHPSRYIGKTRWEAHASSLQPDQWAAHRAQLEAHLPFHDLEYERPNDGGEMRWVSVSGLPVFDKSERFRGYRGIGKDITDRKLDEKRIRYLASHDPLTGLPNRASFGELLNAARQNARRHGRSLAVMFVDLDRFKIINDTLGHAAGDQMLLEMGTRIRHTLRASDIVARLGGDEFVVLVQEVKDTAQMETIARKILAALVKPMLIQGRECVVTASIGICLYPGDGEDEQSLMKNADTAMYRAKEAGRNNYRFYSADSSMDSFVRLAMETSLRRGLERDEFFLHYQPRVSLENGAVTGVEALVRWRHPQLGIVPPAEFISLAEETGIIVELGTWVLKTACEQAVAWQKQGLPAVRMAVNVSARQFASDALMSQITAALTSSNLPPEMLELEVTESVVAQNEERTARVLAQIGKMGVQLALDDFGSGYSSLGRLKRFPIDVLKIDRSFVDGLPDDPEDSAITQAIIAMGHTLGLVIVAEGVETPPQQAFLRVHNCDEFQGFLFSRPLAAADCADFLRRRLEPGSRIT